MQDYKRRCYVAAAELVLLLVAPEPWAVFTLLGPGWGLCGGSDGGNDTPSHVIDALAAPAVGAALLCSSAHAAELRAVVARLESPSSRDVSQQSAHECSSRSGGKAPPPSIAGKGIARAGRFRDVFRGDKVLRQALQKVCEALREGCIRCNGSGSAETEYGAAAGSTSSPSSTSMNTSTVHKAPRQRGRKTTRAEWAALRRAEAQWPPLAGEDDEPDDVDTVHITGHDTGRSDPEVLWMVSRLRRVLDARREVGLAGSPAHLLCVGDGR